MKKEKNGKLSLDSFKTKSLTNSDERSLATLAGGILGACHTCTYSVNYFGCESYTVYTCKPTK